MKLPSATWIAALLVVAGARPAAANIGAPWQGGQRTGDPVGIAGVRVVHEELVLDTRPIADGGVVAISATYHLENPGDAKHLELVFASGSKVAAFRVTLDGEPVASEPVATELPASWRPPSVVPLPDGTSESYELHDSPAPIGVTLDVSAGAHVLAIAYDADAVTATLRAPTKFHELGYVLSPARTWAGFGGLDVTVLVPADWLAAVTPAMARSGDTFHATFPDVPADALALTIQAPFARYTQVKWAAWALFAVVVIGGALVIRRRARRRLLALAWITLIIASGSLTTCAPDAVLPVGQADHYGYGRSMDSVGAVVGTLLAIGVWAVIARLTSGRRP